MEMQRDGEKLTVFARGRIDTNNAPKFARELESALEGVTELIIDCAGLAYISSSGLRVFMQAIKAMGRQRGEMRIVNVSESVYEILETTGFTGACDVEEKK